MKTVSTIIISFFICSHLCYSQGLNIDKVNKDCVWNSDDTIMHRIVNYDPKYFVLGTLSDYLGHFRYVDEEKQVDRYYPSEKPLVKFLEKYIKEELKISVSFP